MEGDRTDLIIRVLRPDDCEWLVRTDEAISGRSRPAYFASKIDRARKESDVWMSLGAEKDGLLVGALMGSVQYGEYGLAEPVAILDTLLVSRDFSRQGIARALLAQMLKNLRALRITCLRTEVAWNETELITFFQRMGFVPAHRLVLEMDTAVDLDAEREPGA